MKKASMKLLSVFLAILMVMFSFPMTVLAELVRENTEEVTEEEGNRGIIELEELRESSTKYFLLEDGSIMAAQYNGAVHYKDENGDWQNIDNTLTVSGSEISTPNAKVKFAKKTTGNESLFTLHDGNRKLTMSLDGAEKKIKGEIRNIKTELSDEAPEIDKLTTLDGVCAAVKYENILDGVDVEYVINGLNIKENIIVKERLSSYSFTFTLGLNNLSPRSTEDGEILLCEGEEVVYRIPAPVMWDAAGASSESVSMTLTDNGNGKYTLVLTADSSWINAAEREFPVTVDPPIYTDQSADMVDIHVTSGIQNGEELELLTVNSGSIAYMRLPVLPGLSESAYISNATLSLTADSTSTGMGYVNVDRVTSAWNEELSWNDIVNNTAGTLARDYSDVQQISAGECRYTWDITPIVKSWYEGANYGLALLPYTNFSGNTFFKSSENSEEAKRPQICITYRDMKGLEDYWTFSSQSAGFAGDGYVNNTVGELTFTIPTISTTDALMPITPTLVYSSGIGREFVSKGKRTNDAYEYDAYGYGFTLNLCETLERKLYSGEDSYAMYYIWTDSDGTEHAFESVGSGVFEDEDGLKLKLTGTVSEITITDSDHNIRKFQCVDNKAYLKSIEDKSGNKLIFQLNSSYLPTAVKLLPVGYEETDAITQMTLSYGSQNQLMSVSHPTSGESIKFYYKSTLSASASNNTRGYLSKIEYLNGSEVIATAEYSYDSTTEQLISAKNCLTGYSLNYVYDTKGRVIEINEGVASTQGQKLTFEYGTTSTVVRTSGTDDVHGNADDLLSTYVYDTDGRVINCYTTDLTRTQLYGASNREYEDDNAKAKNSLKSSGSTAFQSSNYLLNGGFESGQVGWTVSGNVSVIAEKYFSGSGFGTSHANLRVSSNGARSSIKQGIGLEAGKYTFSVEFDTFESSDSRVYMSVKSNEDSSISIVKEIAVDNHDANSEYTLDAITFEVPESYGGAVEFEIYIVGGSSETVDLWIDNAMVGRAIGVSEFDMLVDGNFFSGYYWTLSPSANAVIEESGVAAFGKSLKLTGALGTTVSASQTVYEASESARNGYEADLASPDQLALKLSGWAKGTDMLSHTDGKLQLKLKIEYYSISGTSSEEHELNFDRSVADWQFSSKVILTATDKGMINKITLEALYSNNVGTVLFDNLSLTESENGTSYTYDSQGYVTKVQTGRQSVAYSYDSSYNVTEAVYSDGRYTRYSYDSNNRMTQEIYGRVNGGQHTLLHSTQYIYVAGGMVTSTLTFDFEDDNAYLETLTEYYTDSAPHIYGTVSKETDGLGKVTEYYYNTNNGRLTAVIYPDLTAIVYSYDKMGNVTEVAPAAVDDMGTGYAFQVDSEDPNVNYSYNSATKRLERIETQSTAYTFTYDVFGNSTSIKAGNNTLASYEYNSNNGKLSVLTYGNGLKVKYLYDVLDRIEKIQYNTGTNGAYETVYEYVYETSGRLHSVIDYSSDEVWLYKYDESGKLIHSVAYDSESYLTSYSKKVFYNDDGKVALFSDNFDYNLDQLKLTYNYDYNSETGNVEKLTVSGNKLKVTVTPTYDNFGRTEAKSIGFFVNGSAVLNIGYSYTYVEASNGAQSYLVAQQANGVLNSTATTNVSTVYNYTYDDMGNITQITDASGVVQNKYYYDDLGQLTREDNRALSRTYVWTYDNAGNILRKRTYAFTTGALGTVLSTQSYTYGNAVWGDLLTKIGDSNVTYDAIGNPISVRAKDSDDTYDYGYNMTWNGRELLSYTEFDYLSGSNEQDTVTYTYNIDGARTSKTVNGVEHKYIVDGSRIVAESWTENGVEHFLVFIYDEMGAPIALKYRTGTYAAGTFDYYFFEKNYQGDVIAIYNDSGVKIGSYNYDGWGDFTITRTSGTSILEYNILYTYNPFRYRGYYYDVETGWYYLQSRYYSPSWGRFINADSIDIISATPTGLTDKNLFAYCDNNPITRTDDGGEFWHVLAGAAVGVIGKYVSDVVTNVVSGETGWNILKPRSSVVDYIAAGASGAIAATGIGVVGAKLANAAIEGTAYVANQLIAGEEVNKAQLATKMVYSFVTSSKGINGSKLRGVYKRSNQVLKTAVSPKKIAMYTAKKSSVRKTVTTHISGTFNGSFKSGVYNGIKERIGWNPWG